MGEPERASYGVDSPALVGLAGTALVAGLGLIGAALALWWSSGAPIPDGYWFLGVGLLGAGTAAAVGLLRAAVRSRLRTRDALSRAVELPQAARVLDASPAAGMLLFGILGRFPDARGIGVDSASPAPRRSAMRTRFRSNARAERVSERSWLVEGEARQLPFRSDTFDLVLSGGALARLDGRESFRDGLLELARVVRPGGQLALVAVDAWRMELYGELLDGGGFSSDILRGVGLFTPPIVIARKPSPPVPTPSRRSDDPGNGDLGRESKAG